MCKLILYFLKVLYCHFSQVRLNIVYIVALALSYQCVYFKSQPYVSIHSNLIVSLSVKG